MISSAAIVPGVLVAAVAALLAHFILCPDDRHSLADHLAGWVTERAKRHREARARDQLDESPRHGR